MVKRQTKESLDLFKFYISLMRQNKLVSFLYLYWENIMKNFVFFGLMALSMLGFGGAGFAKEVTAKLSEAQAKERLLESYPEAEISKSKLEEEGGLPVYAVEIKTKDGQMLEVELNGDTGTVLEVEAIDKDD